MFWISAANTWCSKYRNKALEKRIKTGVHSPGMFRSDGFHFYCISNLLRACLNIYTCFCMIIDN